MGIRIVAGVVGFVVVVLLVQSYVLGGDDDDDSGANAGAAPTATLPAELPEPIPLANTEGGAPAGEGAAATGTTTYIVQEGDTMGTIATAFDVPPEAQAAWINEVLEANGIEDARFILVGQELQVPNTPAPLPEGEAQQGQPPAEPTPVAPAAEGVYIVVSGDSPLFIAEKFCVENPVEWANELISINGDFTTLIPGQELVLPAGTPPQCVQ